jgi:hypothetical protein
MSLLRFVLRLRALRLLIYGVFCGVNLIDCWHRFIFNFIRIRLNSLILCPSLTIF